MSRRLAGDMQAALVYVALDLSSGNEGPGGKRHTRRVPGGFKNSRNDAERYFSVTSGKSNGSQRFASVIHASRKRMKCSRSNSSSISSARAAIRAAVFQAVWLFCM